MDNVQYIGNRTTSRKVIYKICFRQWKDSNIYSEYKQLSKRHEYKMRLRQWTVSKILGIGPALEASYIKYALGSGQIPKILEVERTPKTSCI